jgi:hypothetical protein
MPYDDSGHGGRSRAETLAADDFGKESIPVQDRVLEMY